MKKVKFKEGYIYIISNPNFSNYYKLGITDNIKSRLQTYQTSCPSRNYKIEHYIFHSDCCRAEKQIHQKLKYFATERKNEWFRCDLSILKNIIDEFLDPLEGIIVPYNLKVDI